MLVFGVEPLIIAGIIGFSIAANLLANWLVAGRRRAQLPRRIDFVLIVGVAGNLVWMLLLVAAAVVAARYGERVQHAALFYGVFATLGFCLSWLHAHLLQAVVKHWHTTAEDPQITRRTIASLVHTFCYLLLALVLFLLIMWVSKELVSPWALAFLVLGALLPDLDSPDTVVGRILPFLSWRLKSRAGSLDAWHSLGANVLVAAAALPLIWIVGLQSWYALCLGFFSHLALDLLTPAGTMLFWPLTRNRYRLGDGWLQQPGGRLERYLAAGLLLVGGSLVLAVDIGQPGAPTAPALSFEQSLDRYRSLRGRNLVFAFVEGSWQATGRRISGRFEVLNAANESFLLLDRYSGKVFTAGRAAEDNLYADRVVLQTGSAATIKPAEIHLQSQLLGDGLDTLYEMQRESGVEHIFVSGDVLLESSEGDNSIDALPIDYSQTSVRHILNLEDGHYKFTYLPAGDFIALAAVRVVRADLVYIATLSRPATGPTVTPLPLPPTLPEESTP
jgi:inner membrane protein